MKEEGLKQLLALADGVRLEGPIGRRAFAFLNHHGYTHTIRHSSRVAALSVQLARRFSQHAGCSRIAAFLHDISAVIPNHRRLALARFLGVEVVPAEEQVPMLLHQKISREMASALFGVHRQEILSTIECHTTLKPGASTLDLILFVADKIAWDQQGRPPYGDQMLAALETSLDSAALVYLDYLWENKESLPALHPWAVSAREELRNGQVGLSHLPFPK